jgi:hypothetical protein
MDERQRLQLQQERAEQQEGRGDTATVVPPLLGAEHRRLLLRLLWQGFEVGSGLWLYLGYCRTRLRS